MRKRKRILCLTLAILLVTLTGCNTLRNARPITDVTQLDGQRIGVAIAWAPDYLLTDREDMTLVRYNTIADLATALCFQRVDAIAVEQALAPNILKSIQGVRCIETPLSSDGVTTLIAPTRQDIRDEFNAFIAAFRTTQDYADLEARAKNMDGFVAKEVPVRESDRVLKVAFAEEPPFSYTNLETGAYEGIGIEIIRWYAYTCGYTLELTGGTWESMDLGVCSSQYDIGIGASFELYRNDYEMINLCFMSDSYMEMDILFIEIEDPEKLAVVAVIEE